MSKYESSIKQVPYSQRAVYDNISNLENLSRLRDRVPEDKVKDFAVDRDTISMNLSPVGELKIGICGRDEPQCVKFGSLQSPVPFNLWIQVLPVTETTSKLKVTVKADLNPLLRAMVSGPLQEAVEKIADALALVPYE